MLKKAYCRETRLLLHNYTITQANNMTGERGTIALF